MIEIVNVDHGPYHRHSCGKPKEIKSNIKILVFDMVIVGFTGMEVFLNGGIPKSSISVGLPVKTNFNIF